MSKLKSIQQSLLSRIEPSGEALVISAAVSGGVDSVAMLLLLQHYCRMKKLRLCVFHVDHGLRESSVDDRRWVEELANKLGLDFYWRRAVEADKAGAERPGSEAWARRFRYECFAQLLEESGADLVATGHTADDQAETVIMRMLRGCGIAGAGGIRSRRRISAGGKQLRLWRPLLKLTRNELVDYLAENRQDWREDETNRSEVFFRNLVRHRIMPLFNQAAPGATQHIVALADETQQLHTFLQRSAAAFLRKYKDGNSLSLKRKPPTALRHEVIRLWLIEAALGEAVNRALIRQIDELWIKNSGGRRVVCQKKTFCRCGRTIVLTDCCL
ncbi:MAG: tRNA lysidine(34) synthetase TilS [Candidatus Riflebacteria bacterium]|nr:tRNA lysidine(34) synthetase TilS [Candidatus Riflebacteria bacterium]